MTIEKEDKRVDQKRNMLVEIRFDKEGKELLGWAIDKVAEPGDHLVAVHVCRYSEDTSKETLLLKYYVEIFRGLCDIKKVKLTGKVLRGKSIRKTLVREAELCAAVAVIFGGTKHGSIGERGWKSMAKYCAKHLPSTTEILTVHNGNVVFRRSSSDHPPEVSGTDSKSRTLRMMMDQSNSEASYSTDSSEELLENKHAIVIDIHTTKEAHQRSVSLCTDEQRPGWPLLRRASLPTHKALHSRKLSVVQWVMSLPDRSPPETPQSRSTDTCSSKSESSLGGRSSHSMWSTELLEEPYTLPFELNLSDFTWFSYKVLRHATSQFSSENLIGKGGCSRVYKGVFLDGKKVAVKVVNSSKQAWDDFSLEMNIMSCVRHTNITPLLGVCIHNTELICVYEFMSRGSLEDNLHGEKQKSCLSWEARFRIAVGIAEALIYLHNGCSRPVIHRDVKSSNILLSEDFEPQLSDFGLAIWGPNSSLSETYTDVVGTFGYLAPEYFMYGKVTDKLDVYSFGVVLLELVSGRKPIDSCKGQESLVIWAKPILESGSVKGLLDPMLGCYDESQMQRMVKAATLCLTRAARLRPYMSQILRLLKGEEESVETWVRAHVSENGDVKDDDEEIYHNANKTHLSLALNDVAGHDFTLCSGIDPGNRRCLADYLHLQGRCGRFSSFD